MTSIKFVEHEGEVCVSIITGVPNMNVEIDDAQGEKSSQKKFYVRSR